MSKKQKCVNKKGQSDHEINHRINLPNHMSDNDIDPELVPKLEAYGRAMTNMPQNMGWEYLVQLDTLQKQAFPSNRRLTTAEASLLHNQMQKDGFLVIE